MLRGLRRRGGPGATTCRLLVVLLAAGYYGPARAWAESGISVVTEPAGAAVFVNGQPAGTAPVILGALPAGDHRITVAKAGYLENSRVVSVQPGHRQAIHVRLTANPLQAEPDEEKEKDKGGGGKNKKWIFIGLGAAAVGTGVYLVARDTNEAPVAGTIGISPSGVVGVMAVTTFTLTASASDPDGDTLSYNWNLGDGSTAAGATVTHTYQRSGSFQVTLEVSDGKKRTSVPSVSVSVRDLNGTWVSTNTGTTRTWVLTQSGTSVSGTYQNAVRPDVPGTVRGTLSAPRSISVTASLSGYIPFVFTGEIDNQVAQMTGRAMGSGFTGETMIFVRQ